MPFHGEVWGKQGGQNLSKKRRPLSASCDASGYKLLELEFCVLFPSWWACIRKSLHFHCFIVSEAYAVRCKMKCTDCSPLKSPRGVVYLRDVKLCEYY